jgi:predicted Rossmann fold flavoprotein
MMAAITAARCGASVVLLEKKRHPGMKLRITGRGRCNFTNTCDKGVFLENVPGNGRFLHSALAALSPESLMRFFEELGVQSVIERGGRVFPASGLADEIVSALRLELQRCGVDLRVGWKADSLSVREPGGFRISSVNRPDTSCDCAVVATGGITYPQTGSTGDGYALLERAGHTVIYPRPSLVPLHSDAPWIARLQGLSLRNVKAALVVGEERVQEQFGEMLFTRIGLSGPIILTLSRQAVRSIDERQRVWVSIDLKPALDKETLDERLVRDLTESSRKSVKVVLTGALPRLLVPVFAERWAVDVDKRCAQVTRDERRRMVDLLKDFTVPISGYGALEEAVVTQGGIDVREIDPTSMESRLIRGLYVCGEVLDIDGYTGGYNLHIAFATGFVAGRSAALRGYA